MIIRPSANDLQALIKIANQIASIDAHSLRPLTEKMVLKNLDSGDLLIREGEANETEYFVLGGLLRTFVLSPQGDEVTLGFRRAPGILSPSVTRSEGGRSRVNVDALERSTTIAFPFALLVSLMQADNTVQAWGDGVLRQDLMQRSKRELALATLSGANRLAEFRRDYVGMEDTIPHHMIASYLAMTPVTLSRLRNK